MYTHPASFGRGLYGLVLAFPVALFTQAMLTDIAYLKTEELQWSNFSAWAIVGGLVFGGSAFLWSLFGVLRFRSLTHSFHSVLLLAMCLFGLVNAFKHSQDGWSSVGSLGMTLSVLSCVCALVAGLLHYTGTLHKGAVR